MSMYSSGMTPPKGCLVLILIALLVAGWFIISKLIWFFDHVKIEN